LEAAEEIVKSTGCLLEPSLSQQFINKISKKRSVVQRIHPGKQEKKTDGRSSMNEEAASKRKRKEEKWPGMRKKDTHYCFHCNKVKRITSTNLKEKDQEGK
jgi:hypothetical protein